MSDRRVLAVSAACITAAIFLFLLGTYPSWKAAIGGSLSWRSDAPAVTDAPATTPAPQGRPAQTRSEIVQPTASSVGAARPATPPAAPARDVRPAAAPASTSASSPAPMPAAASAPVSTSTAASASAPSFDIVRVEPNGDSVVAARAKAGATVTLLDQGHPIAQAQADAGGQVAFVPPALAPGDHSLMLSLGEPDAPGSLSSQSVAVSVPAQAKAAPMVALLQPDQPTRLLSTPAPASAPGAAAVVPPVSVGAIDVEEMGSIFATGRAAPNSQCRIYLNGSFVANVLAGKDGTWSLKIEHGMRPGHYSVRVDQLASAAGDVQARAEVPFDYPARAASSVSLLRPRKGSAPLLVAPTQAAGVTSPIAKSGEGSASGPAASHADQAAVPAPAVSQTASASTSVGESVVPTTPPDAGVPAVVAQLLTTKVVHGDSLWRISRKMLGHGRRYTQIYAANTTQIRNPRLIYPGQIFVMPQATP